MEETQILMGDRKKFDTFVYLSIADAFEEIERRRNDTKLQHYINDTVGDVPEILKDKKALFCFDILQHQIMKSDVLLQQLSP